MLFKALIRRLNGGTDVASTKVSSSHRRSSTQAYEAFPNLQRLVTRLLVQGSQSPLEGYKAFSANDSSFSISMRAQSVFAALEVIAQFGIPQKCDVDVQRLLWQYAESSDWSLREKAAKTLSLVMDHRNVEAETARLLQPPNQLQNALHGKLLYLRFMTSQNKNPLVGEMLSKWLMVNVARNY